MSTIDNRVECTVQSETVLRGTEKSRSATTHNTQRASHVTKYRVPVQCFFLTYVLQREQYCTNNVLSAKTGGVMTTSQKPQTHPTQSQISTVRRCCFAANKTATAAASSMPPAGVYYLLLLFVCLIERRDLLSSCVVEGEVKAKKSLNSCHLSMWHPY